MSQVDDAAVEEWQAAIGRSETRRERIEHESVRRFALAVGADPDVERILPPLAHWACFLPNAQDGEIGSDGHARRGAFLPAITLPRRMFAASTIAFEAGLALGEDAELVSTLASVIHKRGRSGDLVFVDVDRVLTQNGDVRVRERQSYVYRGDGEPAAMPEAASEAIAGELWKPGPANLFRFSAATFNSHRIHYDLDYARSEEGYPALVIHGPFTAVKLAALAWQGGGLRNFSFRAQAPLFLGQAVRLQREATEVRAVRCDGETAMTAKLVYA